MTRRPVPPSHGPGIYEKVPGIEMDGYDVYSHSDDPVPGRTPPNAVLFVMRQLINGKPFRVAMRFKSRAAIDQFIDTLETHAVTVWPKNEKT